MRLDINCTYKSQWYEDLVYQGSRYGRIHCCRTRKRECTSELFRFLCASSISCDVGFLVCHGFISQIWLRNRIIEKIVNAVAAFLHGLQLPRKPGWQLQPLSEVVYINTPSCLGIPSQPWLILEFDIALRIVEGFCRLLPALASCFLHFRFQFRATCKSRSFVTSMMD